MKKIFTIIFLAAYAGFGAIVMHAQRGVFVKENSGERAEKRLALVIGNGAYQHTDPLNNPVNDAADIEKALKELGFEVVLGTNQTKQGMERLIRQFGNRLAETKAVGLVFYAGHGISRGGVNYLIPVDADIQEEDEIEYHSVGINFVLGKMTAAGNDFNLVILDACRNNPFARRWRNYRDLDESKGLVNSNPPRGTMVLYATTPGDVSIDGVGNSKNGVFTAALLKQIKTPNLELEKLMKNVVIEVEQVSKKRQSPWKEGLYSGDFYFAGNNLPSARPEPAPETQVSKPVFLSGEQAFWQEAERKNNTTGYESYISNYPKGEFVPLANFRIQELLAKAKSLYDEADKLRSWSYSNNEKNNEKAIELLTKAIEIHPNYDQAYNGRGIAYRSIGKDEEAIADFTKMIQIDPKSGSGYFNRCVTYLGKENYFAARSDAEKLIGLEPKDGWGFYFHGQASDGLGLYDVAIADFTSVIELKSSFFSVDEVYSRRGKAYLKKLDYNLAIADFTKSIGSKLNSSRGPDLSNRGKAYLGKGEYSLAINDFTNVIELNGAVEETYLNRAKAYDAIGDTKSAEADRKKAASLKK